MSYYLRSDESRGWTRKGNPLGVERMKLAYRFAKHVIMSFQNLEADYVEPFLEPVDPEADGAADYYTVVKYPMDLSTMLRELRGGKYVEIFDVTRSFNRMFANCFKYNSSRSDVYRKGMEFQKAFRKVWAGKDDWIEAEAAKLYASSTRDLVGASSEDVSDQTSDDDQTEPSGESDEDTQEDDESYDPPARRQRNVLGEDYSTDDDTSDDDRMEDSSESESEASDGDLPPVKRQRFNKLKPTKDDTFKNHEQKKNRDRKKDGSKRHLANANIISELNTNHKRPLNTTAEIYDDSLSSRDQAASTEPPNEARIPSPNQQQETPVDGPAKKSRLESIFQDHFQDGFQVPTQQPQTEHPQTEHPQTEQLPVHQQQSARLPAQEQQTSQPPEESPSEHSIQQPHQQPTQEEKYCICLTPAFPPPLTASHQVCQYDSCLKS
jgi:hypothetical protein